MATKILIAKKERTNVDELALQYKEFEEQKKFCEEKMSEIKDKVRKEFIKTGKNELRGKAGGFILTQRNYFSWPIEAIKKALGKKWTSYVEVDTKKVRELMESSGDDKLYNSAQIKAVDVIVFQK